MPEPLSGNYNTLNSASGASTSTGAPWQYILYSIILFLLILFSAIFSASETAYTTVSRAKIENMIEKKQKFAKLIQKQHLFFNRILGTILIANNLVNIASATLFSYVLSLTTMSSGKATIISTVVMTPLIVLFAEILPKLIAKAYPERVIRSTCWFIEALYWIFFPITYPISKIGKKIYITNTEEDMKNLINIAQDEGVLEINESTMAKNVLDLDSSKVSQNYVKLKDIDYLNYKATLQDALNKFKETNYSRLPIEKDGDMIGILLLKDIFFLKRGNIMNYVKTVPKISANSLLSIALEKLRKARAQMGFVIKNNNDDSVIGIITIEDIIEEVVGEIYDEYDDDEQIYEISLERCEARGNVKISTIWKRFEWDEILNLEAPNDEDLNLSNWLKNRVGHELHVNTKYTYEDKIDFQVISLKNKDQKFDIIDIDWSK